MRRMASSKGWYLLLRLYVCPYSTWRGRCFQWYLNCNLEMFRHIHHVDYSHLPNELKTYRISFFTTLNATYASGNRFSLVIMVEDSAASKNRAVHTLARGAAG